MTFNLTSSILPLITSLKLVYGRSLQVDPILNPIPPEEIPADGQSSVVVSQLPNVDSINYLFQLRTVIGFYTYDSAVVQLYPMTEATPTDVTTLTPGTSANGTTSFTPSISPPFLPAPTTVQVATPVVPTSILVTWSKLADASGYVIQYYNDSELVGVTSVSVHMHHCNMILYLRNTVSCMLFFRRVAWNKENLAPAFDVYNST